ncbi:CD276 antigen-like isoform X1 [Solea senegalensis]|uniref:CD276 antigen-like isoform X1 n=1 Tax=Solea senegalensis TaxID=28829 RepID=A0AAV6QQV7_SOLSE|nr:CD276 antigen-like isoform X1 [Solea senegalensis]
MLDGHVTRTRTTMELFLVLVSLLFVTRCGKTTAEESVVINMVVREGDDAVLSCSLGSRSIKQELFDWKKDGQKEVFMYNRGTHYNNNPTNQDPDFRGRVFHFAQQLDVGNASVVIRPTKVTDSGSYTCDFPFHQPRRRSHIVLVVGECFHSTQTKTKRSSFTDGTGSSRQIVFKRLEGHICHGPGCEFSSVSQQHCCSSVVFITITKI